MITPTASGSGNPGHQLRPPNIIYFPTQQIRNARITRPVSRGREDINPRIFLDAISQMLTQHKFHFPAKVKVTGPRVNNGLPHLIFESNEYLGPHATYMKFLDDSFRHPSYAVKGEITITGEHKTIIIPWELS